jgi:hypothetical protein
VPVTAVCPIDLSQLNIFFPDEVRITCASSFRPPVSPYESSKLEITRQLLTYSDWSPERVEERQASLLELAKKMWPEELV